MFFYLVESPWLLPYFVHNLLMPSSTNNGASMSSNVAILRKYAVRVFGDYTHNCYPQDTACVD